MAQHMAQQNAEGSRDLSTLVDASAELQHLVQTIWRLRQPDGCPWDREQTHRSIGKNMIEGPTRRSTASRPTTRRTCARSWATCSCR